MLFSDLPAIVELKSGERGGVRERKASSEGLSPRPLLLSFSWIILLFKTYKQGTKQNKW
jgi:hypothetical protein